MGIQCRVHSKHIIEYEPISLYTLDKEWFNTCAIKLFQCYTYGDSEYIDIWDNSFEISKSSIEDFLNDKEESEKLYNECMAKNKFSFSIDKIDTSFERFYNIVKEIYDNADKNIDYIYISWF